MSRLLNLQMAVTSYLWPGAHTKVVLVVCLLPLIPDHVHFAATEFQVRVFCDQVASVPDYSTSYTPGSFQSRSHPRTRWQPHLQASPCFLRAVGQPSSERAFLKVLPPREQGHNSRRKVLARFWLLQVEKHCNSSTVHPNKHRRKHLRAQRALLCSRDSPLVWEQGWGLQLDTYQGSSYHQLFSSTVQSKIAEAWDNLVNPGKLLDFCLCFQYIGIRFSCSK